jgi:hypothetical protein
MHWESTYQVHTWYIPVFYTMGISDDLARTSLKIIRFIYLTILDIIAINQNN